VKFGQKWKNGSRFSELKMAAAAMLDSGRQTFFDAIDELFIQILNIPTNFGKMW